MTTLYKLTEQDCTTHGGCKWGDGATHETDGSGDMCGPGWLHAYTHPLLAVLFNPIHANFSNPLLWECEGEIGKNDRGLKVGCTRLTTLRRIPLPEISTEQRVKFAILCALKVCAGDKFVQWANAWLDGSDRSEKSAARAADYAMPGGADAAYTIFARDTSAAAYAAAACVARAAERGAVIDLIALAKEAVS